MSSITKRLLSLGFLAAVTIFTTSCNPCSRNYHGTVVKKTLRPAHSAKQTNFLTSIESYASVPDTWIIEVKMDAGATNSYELYGEEGSKVEVGWNYQMDTKVFTP